MTDSVDGILAHHGIEVGDELKHYGKKGMKWGVRNEDSGGGGRGGWTEDQKKKARNVAVIAGVVAVGAAYAAAKVYAHGSMDNASVFSSSGTAQAGAKIADTVLKAKGDRKLLLDADTRAFIKDAPARILSDQRGWSNSFGKSLSSIQKEDAAFMADYIKNFAPKAIGA